MDIFKKIETKSQFNLLNHDLYHSTPQINNCLSNYVSTFLTPHNKISKRAFISNLNFQLVPKIVPNNYY